MRGTLDTEEPQVDGAQQRADPKPTPSSGPPTQAGYDFRDPLLGARIGEKYLVESLIDAGGMGRVYRAKHVLIDRVVASK